MSTALLYPHAEAILAQLATTGLRIGDHQAPKSDDGKIVTPCVVLYMTPGVTLGGSVGCDDDAALLRFRATAVGLTAGQAQHTADLAFAALDGAELVVADRGIFRVRRTGTAGVLRDDQVKPVCFYAATPYSLMSTSA